MKLFNYRKKRKLTLAQFGDLIGVSAETIRRYEAYSRFPERRILVKIAQVTSGRVKPNDFIEAAW